MQQFKEKLEQALKQIPIFKNLQKQVRMMITAEGLRIDLLETQHGLFFETGNPKPTEAGKDLLQLLAAELVKLPNKVAIEGHTDSTPYGRSDYSNWELSADRANAARRILNENGLPETRISQVRGFADQTAACLRTTRPTRPIGASRSSCATPGWTSRKRASAQATRKIIQRRPTPAATGKN